MSEQEALWSQWCFCLWLTPLHWPGTGSDPVHGSTLWSFCSSGAVLGDKDYTGITTEKSGTFFHQNKCFKFWCQDVVCCLHPHCKQHAMEVHEQSGKHSWSVYCQKTAYQTRKCGQGCQKVSFVLFTQQCNFILGKSIVGQNSLQPFFEGVQETNNSDSMYQTPGPII